MRGPALLLSAAIAFVLSPVAGRAHTGERVFFVQELATADLPNLHDGSLEDWEEVMPFSSLDHFDTGHQEHSEGQPFDASDIALRVFLAWHNASQRIYVGAEFVDDVACSAESLQFMLDGDHSGGPYGTQPQTPEERQAESQAQFYQVMLHPADGRDPVPRGSPLLSWVYQEPWIDIGLSQFGVEPTQTLLEMQLTPWDEMGEGAEDSRRSGLRGGNVIGFQLAFPDFDPELEAVYVIGNTSVGVGGFHTNASKFADGLLIPCEHLDCSGAETAVVRDSWGRIKAGLR